MRVRRTGVCAAFALVFTMYASAAWGVYEKEFVNQQDFSAGSREGLTFVSELGGLSLSQCKSLAPFVWAPSPSDSTVSRIYTRSGIEDARYRIGPLGEHWTPVSVAADKDGNAYIACSVPNQVGKIVVILANSGCDRNHDNVITTSADYDRNSQITPTEILPWGEDERVFVVSDVGLPGETPSALVCDGKGSLWVALNERRRVENVDIQTGKVVALVDVVGKPSTLLLGKAGALWVLSTEDAALTEVDTMMNSIASYCNLEFSPAGMVMDRQDKLWFGNTNGGIVSLDTVKHSWAYYYRDGDPGVTGVALGPNGDIWAACPAISSLGHFSGVDGSLSNEIPLGTTAPCVCADADGYIWALRDYDSGAIKIDPRSERVLGMAETGRAPFSSTPFASAVTRTGLLPSGSWHTVLDSQLNGAGWGMVTWKGDLNGGLIKVEVKSADTLDDLLALRFNPVPNGLRFEAPNGRYLEVRATLEGSGDCTPTLYALRVDGTNLPPDISKAAVNVPRIGRLDHVMESVQVIDVTDPEGDPFKVVVTGVTQDEPVSGLGPDDKAPDAILTGGDTVWLRGECDPGTKEQPGNGRVYVVSFKATDALGAVSTGKVKVLAGPTIKTTDVAIQDTKQFDSTEEVFQNVAKAP